MPEVGDEMNGEESTKELLVGELEEIRRRADELEALVTKFEGAGQLLVKKEGDLSSLWECPEDPLVVYDLDGRALYINSSFVKTFGWSPDEVLGRRIDYVPQECWPETKETLDRLFKGESVGPFTTKRMTKVGSVLDIHIGSAMFTDTRGNPAGHIVTLRDIRKWNQRERALRESEERLELALNGPDLSFWSWDIAGDLMERSENWGEMMGYGPQEAVSSDVSWNQLVHPQEKSLVEMALKDHLEGRTPQYEAEYRLMTKAGDWKWVRDRGKVVAWDAQGNPLRVTGIQTDITASKRSEEKIQLPTHSLITALERERERIYLDLHGKVAQDLAALRIAFEMLFEDLTATTSEAKRSIAQISEGLRGAINRVRDISYELRPPGLDELGLVSTVKQYCRDCSEKNPLEVDLHTVGFDRLSMEFHFEINLFRVIEEALCNVVKHANASQVTVELRAELPLITLLIEDDGSGFDVKEELGKAPAERARGLWSMEQRVNLLHGEMSIESIRGRGTSISVTVPYGRDRG